MTSPLSSLQVVHAQIEAETAGSEDGARVVGWLERLCRAAARGLPAAGVAVSLIRDGAAQLTVAASSPLSRTVDGLQFELGEGPCLEACSSGRPVLTPDLGAADRRWPGYTQAVRAHGVEAVFAFPLQLGTACFGAIDVYRQHPGTLSARVLTQALAFAHVATTGLIDAQGDVGAAAWDASLEQVLAPRMEVYQAQGMVMVQLGVDMSVAMDRMRAYAFAHDLSLDAVAADVLARRLVLEADRN